jgi:hypothetical protein
MQKEKHLFSELRKLCLLSLLMIASAGLMFAQVNVTGVVTDADGETLVGVNVIERGTAHGTITDIDGKFALDVASPNSYLVFSYVGFTTQEVQVGNTRNFNIVHCWILQLHDAALIYLFSSISVFLLFYLSITSCISKSSHSNTEH